jgi:uncharacterized protein (DUF302 family)
VKKLLQVHSTFTPAKINAPLRAAVDRRGGGVMAVARLGQLLSEGGADAIVLTICFADQYTMMLQADIRFAMLLPVRIAVFATEQGSVLATISPREFCQRTLQRIDLELLAGPLEDSLRAVMEDAAQACVAAVNCA